MNCMFIDTVDETNPQFFAQNLEQYIKDPDNPYYDAKKAKEICATIAEAGTNFPVCLPPLGH